MKLYLGDTASRGQGLTLPLRPTLSAHSQSSNGRRNPVRAAAVAGSPQPAAASLRTPLWKPGPPGPKEHHVILCAQRPPLPDRACARGGGGWGAAVGRGAALRPSSGLLGPRRGGQRPGCGAGRLRAPLPRHGSGGRWNPARPGDGGPSLGSGGGGGGSGGRGLAGGRGRGLGSARLARLGPAP